MSTWQGGTPVKIERPHGIGWGLLGVRAVLCCLVFLFLLGPLVLSRALGFWPVGQAIVRLTGQLCLKIIGLRLRVHGTPMQRPGIIVANHVSWLDILTLHACQRVFFVAKSEVRGWPGIGFLAKAAGTIFIRRKRSDVKEQNTLFEAHMHKGHKLLIFPEGTSTDGMRVLPFRSSLFEAFFAPDLIDQMWIQPVTVFYQVPPGKRASFYSWWGDMTLIPHMGQVLSQPRQGHADVTFHDPLRVRDFPDRKALAQKACAIVSSVMPDVVPD